MGSVKDLIRDDSFAGKLYTPATARDFGRGVWRVSGRFSVGDLKNLIPDTNIKDKAEALTMMTARFFEYLATERPFIETCYLGLLNSDGKIVGTEELMDNGERSNLIVMKLAHVPDTFSGGDLDKYRQAMASGELRCCVADVESIFRKGLPLGSSFFKDVFNTFGNTVGNMYESLSSYDATVAALNDLRHTFNTNPALEQLLSRFGLKEIPNPGFVLTDIVYDTTTKFEAAGDRKIDAAEARLYSGLSDNGYKEWTTSVFPQFARDQIKFCRDRGILNIDGKGECVAYKGGPVVTDFACTVDENREMIIVEYEGVQWAIPTNKEIQRAIFRREGIYTVINEAKEFAKSKGDVNTWKEYVPKMLKAKNIDIKAVSEHSCNLMADAIGEVANRQLGRKVFDAKPIDSWVGEFLPYASKITYQS